MWSRPALVGMAMVLSFGITARADASRAARPLELVLKVLPTSATRPDALIILRLHNRGRRKVLVQQTAAPDRGLFLFVLDEAGRRIGMRARPMVSVPAIRRNDFTYLLSGQSLEYRFRWADHLKYRGNQPVRRDLYVVYSTDDALDAYGQPVEPRVSLQSNRVRFQLSPNGSPTVTDRF